ncbi:hypothetical protein BBBOND_0111170 [Babesia bigemina]|uniref:Uncharacterized protein n=1 Tax=Babesia bigemina TaxID=5866 RepID=A0A061D7G5_BABBI|nr:hypothetical protein BBBOND_0111170 [Babesia bigemina]CDR94819.1 hypothetical protein BBBOND_0111170 [Babesia bigemina]|eukprot:XP_012767005.1 hypothetical protein BBBOND_0111170 [Babesia bigemina]
MSRAACLAMRFYLPSSPSFYIAEGYYRYSCAGSSVFQSGLDDTWADKIFLMADTAWRPAWQKLFLAINNFCAPIVS